MFELVYYILHFVQNTIREDPSCEWILMRSFFSYLKTLSILRHGSEVPWQVVPAKGYAS